MEAKIIPQFKNYCSLSPSTQKESVKFSGPIVSIPVKKTDQEQDLIKQRIKRCGQISNCAKGFSVSEVEKKLGNEFNLEEELIGMKKLNEKCKGVGGIVELLECLEREAIMGEDEGREAIDYNRRAQIFDKSSRVFQALKESTPLD